VPLDNSIGGAGAVPGSWTYGGAVSTSIDEAGTPIPAVQLLVTENIYGVPFRFTVTKTVYDAEGWQALASQYAAIVQSIGAYEGTIGMQYAAEVNASNDLYDALIVTVGTPDGLNAVDVTVPLNIANENANFNRVVAAYTLIQKNLAGG